MLEKLKWHTEKRKIKDLIPTDGNPRQMTKKEAEDLIKSLAKFDLVDIPAINLDNRIIVGHQRARILKSAGREEEEIDVRVPNRQLTEEEHREYMLRSNKNLGSWDFDLLANYDEAILREVGFTEQEIQKKFQLDVKPEIEFTEELLESHNYIVLYFDNDIDWLNLLTLYPLPKVKGLDSKEGYERQGVGRVVKGVDFIKKIKG